MPDSWKLSLPCTKAEAEALARDVPALAPLDEPPVLMTSEPDPARPEEWRLDAYFGEEPDAALLALIVSLVPSFTGPAPKPERVDVNQRMIRRKAHYSSKLRLRILVKC